MSQLRDRPPRYEREQSTVTPTTNTSRDPPPTPIHAVLGEPPPLYSEISNVQHDHEIPERQIEPPPAYSVAFPTIPSVTFASDVNIGSTLSSTEDVKANKDDVASGTSMEKEKEDKVETGTPDSTVNIGNNVER